MIEPGLVDRLEAEVASVSSRVYPAQLPQAASYPALTYRLVSDPREHDGDGPDGLVGARYTVTAYALTYAALKTTRDEVRAALDGWSGTMNGHAVAQIQHAGGPDLFDREAGESGVHYAPVDYLIDYVEG